MDNATGSISSPSLMIALLYSPLSYCFKRVSNGYPLSVPPSAIKGMLFASSRRHELLRSENECIVLYKGIECYFFAFQLNTAIPAVASLQEIESRSSVHVPETWLKGSPSTAPQSAQVFACTHVAGSHSWLHFAWFVASK